MKIQRKLLLIALALLLISVGTVVAASSADFVTPRFVMTGGGVAGSSHYTITSVFGQAVTDVADSPHYKVSGGFLFPGRQGSHGGEQIWLPVIRR